MIKLEKTEIPFSCWEAAIRGMRNPLNSWDKSDTNFDRMKIHYIGDVDDAHYNGVEESIGTPDIGDADLALMRKLAKGGSSHAKYRRMITVYVDITAPLYWWKEFDTYKVGTVANSCSTMHKIHAKPFELDDFSHEHNMYDGHFESVIMILNNARKMFLETDNKAFWYSMIQILPTSYNQKRTVMLNYEVLANMYRDRRHHKLDEWRTLCELIECLPYSELITGGI